MFRFFTTDVVKSIISDYDYNIDIGDKSWPELMMPQLTKVYMKRRLRIYKKIHHSGTTVVHD